MSRQHDAHVRARSRLLDRLEARASEWGSRQSRENLARRLARFEWSPGWGNKMSKYEPFGERQRVIGTYADVPARTLHSIMCHPLTGTSPVAWAR